MHRERVDRAVVLRCSQYSVLQLPEYNQAFSVQECEFCSTHTIHVCLSPMVCGNRWTKCF